MSDIYIGIISEVADISAGRVRLRAGTLYTALDRLRADGLIDVDREEIPHRGTVLDRSVGLRSAETLLFRSISLCSRFHLR